MGCTLCQVVIDGACDVQSWYLSRLLQLLVIKTRLARRKKIQSERKKTCFTLYINIYTRYKNSQDNFCREFNHFQV